MIEAKIRQKYANAEEEYKKTIKKLFNLFDCKVKNKIK